MQSTQNTHSEAPNVREIQHQMNAERLQAYKLPKSVERLKDWKDQKDRKIESIQDQRMKTQTIYQFKPDLSATSQKTMLKTQNLSVNQRNEDWVERKNKLIEEKQKQEFEDKQKQDIIEKQRLRTASPLPKIESKVKPYIEGIEKPGLLKGHTLYYEVIEKINDEPVGLNKSKERMRRNSRSPGPSREPEWLKDKPKLVEFQRVLHKKINSN